MVIVECQSLPPPDRSRLPSPLHCGRQRPHTSRATYQPEKEDIPLMPKFGMRMRMPSALNRIAWYGRGKFENYPDRKSAAFLGVYECGIHEFITNYIVPQDNANRCDTRWFMLGDSERWKIQVKGLQTPMFPYMALRGRRPGRERACARTARTRLHQPEYRLQHTRSRWKTTDGAHRP